jgi:hypothetical protein
VLHFYRKNRKRHDNVIDDDPQRAVFSLSGKGNGVCGKDKSQCDLKGAIQT